jgi:hypothetical protein
MLHGNLYSSRAPSEMSSRSRRQTTNQDMRSHQTSPNSSQTDGSDDSREGRGLIDVDTSQLNHIHIPISVSDPTGKNFTPKDIQNLVSARNLFAFLIGQTLIATESYKNMFEVFLQIAKHLSEFMFSNMDGSTFGEVPDSSFTSYIQELGLADVRGQPRQTVNMLILAEKMRSEVLWNESFIHAVGMWETLRQNYPEDVRRLESLAKPRIERAFMDLEKRQMRANEHLLNFDFPQVFSGLLNSRTAVERELTNFEAWKSSFQATRRFLLHYLKAKYGSWPPKKDKKAPISVPNLNRRVLRSLNADLGLLYDLMLDRTHPSSRLKIAGRSAFQHPDGRIEALRKVLEEYDHSGSPVYPTPPFDAPLLPRLNQNQFDENDIELKRKMPKSDMINILNQSYNLDVKENQRPIVSFWTTFELKSTAGMTIDKAANFRLGSWLFIYCVLQSLPLLTVDAPGVKFSQDIDYFLCQPSRGQVPWSTKTQTKAAFRDPTTGLWSVMPSHIMDLGIDEVYRLSHMWIQGEVWEKQLTVMPGAGATRNPSSARSASLARGNSPSYGRGTSPMASHPEYLPSHPSTPLLSVSTGPSPAHSPAFAQLAWEEQHPYEQPWENQVISPLSNYPQTQGYSGDYQAPYYADMEAPSPVSTGWAPSGYASGGLQRPRNRESILLKSLERLPVPAEAIMTPPAAPMSREERDRRAISMTFEEMSFLPGPAEKGRNKPKNRAPRAPVRF